MVVLNDFLPINISSLKIHLSNKIRDVLEDKLDYYIETGTVIKKENKKRLFDNIIKEVKNNISDHFLYLVMHDDYCTHKYKKGKNEGKYCSKKIRSNNPKKVYLCCQHDKDHIPQKKKLENNINNIDEAIEIKNNIDENNLDDEGYETNNGIGNFNIDYINKEKKIETQKYKINYKNEIKNKLQNVNHDLKILNKGDNIIIVGDSKQTNKCNNTMINNNYFKKKIKIDRNDKYMKKSNWKKLDILKDTGFVFL
jgi:hypothetical protein